MIILSKYITKKRRYRTFNIKIIISFLIVTIISVSILGYYSYDTGRNISEKRLIAQISSISDLTASNLNAWLNERLLDINHHVHSPAIIDFFQARNEGNGLNNKSDNILNYVRNIQFYFDESKNNYNYKQIFLTDNLGTILISTNASDIGKKTLDKYITDQLRSHDIRIEDIFLSSSGEYLMRFIGPIYENKIINNSVIQEFLGIVVYEVDMEDTVYSIISDWPGKSDTGESLLVRQEDGHILFLNDVRHSNNSALNMKISLDSNYALPAIFASQGDTGIIRSKDYRNVDVISSYHYIEIMNWGFVTKIDQQEIFSEINDLRNNIIIFSISLFLIVTFIGIIISRSISNPIINLKKTISKPDIDIANIKINKKLLESQDEIGDLARSFEEMINNQKKVNQKLKVSEKLAAIGQLSGSIAHEIRNPLGAISNSIYLMNMSKKELSEKHQNQLNIMKREINRINIIISDLLDFAKLRDPELHKNDLNKIIHQSLETISIPDNITLELKLDEKLPNIKSESERIKQVLLNIIYNGIQAMPTGGKMTITSSSDKNFINCNISDTGKGISKENLEKIFDPLFTTKTYGTGLGLTIVKNIIDSHKGKIEIKSITNQGTTVIIKIPKY